MVQMTFIDDPNTIILNRDLSMKNFDCSDNKKIKFLPIKMAETFPNLLFYNGRNCSIKELKKKHFENLSRLEVVSFGSNRIETIYSDTFENLTSLQAIDLGKLINFFYLLSQ